MPVYFLSAIIASHVQGVEGLPEEERWSRHWDCGDRSEVPHFLKTGSELLFSSLGFRLYYGSALLTSPSSVKHFDVLYIMDFSGINFDSFFKKGIKYYLC